MGLQLTQDLDELRRRGSEADDVLLTAEHLARTILDQTAEAILVFDFAGRIIRANQAAQNLYGQDCLGRTVETACPILAGVSPPADAAEEQAGRAIGWAELLGVVLQGESVRGVEARFRCAGGGWVDALVSLGPLLNPEGRVLAGVVIFADITERTLAESRLLFLAEAGIAFAASLDYETTLQTIARLAVPCMADWCMIDVLGDDRAIHRAAAAHVDPAKEGVVRGLQGMCARDPSEASEAFQAVLDGRSILAPAVTDSHIALLACDAGQADAIRQLEPASCMLVPLVVRSRTIGMIAFARSHTSPRCGPADLWLAEELARRAATALDNARLYQEAQEAIRLREQFISIASHELRTPMTVLRGYLEGLDHIVRKSLNGAWDDAAAEESGMVSLDRTRLTRALQKMDRAAERLTELIGQLLDVGRLQSGRLTLCPERFDLLGLLSAVVESFQLRQDAGGYSRLVELKLVASPAVGIWGTWDRGRLEQVFVNLIDNAFKYSPPEATITLSAFVEEPGNGGGASAHFTVADQGIGIPPEDHERIFQAFARANNASASHVSGLGLGLAIAREIVERHGGRLWVESDGGGRGSTFHALIPGVEVA